MRSSAYVRFGGGAATTRFRQSHFGVGDRTMVFTTTGMQFNKYAHSQPCTNGHALGTPTVCTQNGLEVNKGGWGEGDSDDT